MYRAIKRVRRNSSIQFHFLEDHGYRHNRGIRIHIHFPFSWYSFKTRVVNAWNKRRHPGERPIELYRKRALSHPSRRMRAGDYNALAEAATGSMLRGEAWDEAYSNKLGFPPPMSYEGG